MLWISCSFKSFGNLKGFAFYKRPWIFLDENHLGSKKTKKKLCHYFFNLDAISESKIVFRGFMVYIQRGLKIYLHHSQSQELPSNSEGRFFSGWKYISLWRSKEKWSMTALSGRGKTLSPRTVPAGAAGGHVDRDKMSQTVRNNWNRLNYLPLTQNIEFS